ncbi:MAG: Fic family protein [Patulibacter sp.]
MAGTIKATWEPTFDLGLPRKARRGCAYDAYLPDRLADREFLLNSETSADVGDAERDVYRLNERSTALLDSEAVARLLLRAEAVASSKIEGLQIGGRRLLKAQLARETDDPQQDVTATEILNNVDAMRWAVETLTDGRDLEVADLQEVHRRLVTGTDLESHGGTVREEQNWIGGSNFNPCSAVFVPPPPDRVQDLLEDLCTFMNQDRLPAIAQAAIAHAQFETIHPFVDGNGRTGRALVHVVLRRRGLAPRVVPPISLVLATWSTDYVNGLMRTRHLGSPDAPEAIDALNDWVALFASACRRAVHDAELYEHRVAEIQAAWRERLGTIRRGSAVERVIGLLPGAPIVTVKSAAMLAGRSVQAVNDAIPRLVEARVLSPTTLGRRNRAFEAAELLDAFNALERQLASPDGDTNSSPPRRSVPARTDR